MKSLRSPAFRSCFQQLPPSIQALARKNHGLWLEDPRHPSLDYKRVGKESSIWSVRVGIGWRALGVAKDDAIVWFWIGSHAQYDRLLRQTR
ncbi:MAG TPA: hypothetical protein VN931_03805 [Fibrobacteria bacterium]|nr:hypothetical protein [Fibrobacteria bacterium]